MSSYKVEEQTGGAPSSEKEEEEKEEGSSDYSTSSYCIGNHGDSPTTSQAAALFHDFMQFGSVGLHIVDNNGIILWANQAELTILGYTADEYFGRHIADFHMDMNKLDSILTTLLAGGKVVNSIAPIRCKDGHTEYFEINSSMRQVDGKCVTTRCFSARVTDRVLREQAQMRALAKEREAAQIKEETRRKTEFLRQLCHELRNPLAGVLGNLELLLGELQQATAPSTEASSSPLSVEEKLADLQQSLQTALDHAESAQLAAEHQMLVINDTLSLSRLESKGFELSPQPVDVSSVIASVQAILGVKAQEKELKLRVTLQDEARFVRVDSVWLKQVLINLMSNSIKFTPAQGKVNVEIACQDYMPQEHHQGKDQDDTIQLQVTVQDTGIGMTDEEQTKLFGVFSQGNERISAQFGGSGLGLHIVKQFLDYVGGTIHVESEKDVGSTFVLTLPCGVLTSKERAGLLAPKTHDYYATGLALPASKADKETMSTTPNIRVLVVDDCPLNRKMLASFLKRKGYSHELAENGLDALKLHTANPFDLILSDVDMPVMDGLEFTRIVRQREQDSSRPAVPIIGISGNVIPEDARVALDAGMNEYVGKPYKFPKLESLMLKCVSL